MVALDGTSDCNATVIRQSARAALAAYERTQPLAVLAIRHLGQQALAMLELGAGEHTAAILRLARSVGMTFERFIAVARHELAALRNPPAVTNPAILECMERLTGERPPVEDPQAMVDYLYRHFD